MDRRGRAGAGDPAQLEDRFVAREGARAHLLGRVLLHERVERQARGSRSDPGDAGDDHGRSKVEVRRQDEAHDRDPDQGAEHDRRLAQGCSRARNEERADEASAAGRRQYQAEALDVLADIAEREREQEHHEAESRARPRSRDAAGQQSRREQLVRMLLGRRLAAGRTPRRGQAGGDHGACDVDDAGEAERDTGPEELLQARARQREQRPRRHRDDRKARVHRYERAAFREDVGNQRAPADPVRPRQHKRAEGQRVQREVLRARGHQEREHTSPDHREEDRDAVRPAPPVQQRADDRREQRERRHRQQQVQPDVRARLVGRHREEKRSGERHRDKRIACRVRRLGEHHARERRPGEEGLFVVGVGRWFHGDEHSPAPRRGQDSLKRTTISSSGRRSSINARRRSASLSFSVNGGCTRERGHSLRRSTTLISAASSVICAPR